jgi:hypothetical protein
VEGKMTACYAIEKDSVGWVIWAGGKAVLTCSQKRTAVDTAGYAGQLLILDGEISACEDGVGSSAPLARRPGDRDDAAVGGIRRKTVQ